MAPAPCVNASRRRLAVALTRTGACTQIALLGVSVGPNGGEVTLQPLHYRTPADGVIMTTVVSTEAGHIFLGGGDGHLYELKYSVASLLKVGRHRLSLSTLLMRMCRHQRSRIRLRVDFLEPLPHKGITRLNEGSLQHANIIAHDKIVRYRAQCCFRDVGLESL